MEQKLLPPPIPASYNLRRTVIDITPAQLLGCAVFSFIPPPALLGLALYYLGYVLWLPWPFLIYADYMTSRAGRFNSKLRYLNALCAGATAATLAGKLVMMDVWKDDPDFRGGLSFVWFVNIAALFAIYAILRLSLNFSPPPSSKSTKSSLVLSPPLVYLVLYVTLIATAFYINAYNSREDYGLESLFIVSSGLLTLGSILNGRRVCSRMPISLIANSLLFVGSFTGVGICIRLTGFHGFAPVPLSHANIKPWYICVVSSFFTGLSLSATLIRSHERRIHN